MVCDRVAILVQGKVYSQGTIDELTRDSRRYEIEVSPPRGLGDNASPQQFLPAALAALARFDAPTLPAEVPPRVSANGTSPMPASALPVLRGRIAAGTPLVIDRSCLRVGTDSIETIQPIIDALRAQNIPIRSIRPVRESLEDLFMKAVTDPTTGREFKPGASEVRP
jgi:ABC-type multidrug transport system ATPase subunit